MACRLFGAKPLSKTNSGLLSIGPLGTEFSEICIKIKNVTFMKMHLKIPSAKWLPFCSGNDELFSMLWHRQAIFQSKVVFLELNANKVETCVSSYFPVIYVDVIIYPWPKFNIVSVNIC